MKNFLAVDTSNGYMSIVAAKDGELFSTFVPDCAMKHSVLLMEKIDETLSKAGMRASDCDFFAVVVGAGSFTGIRIGISAVKGLCLAFDKPALPVTSFDVAAYNTIDNAPLLDTKVLCLVDALHGAYYACGYEKGEVVYPPAYVTEKEVLTLHQQGFALCACESLPLSSRVSVRTCNPAQGLARAVCALSRREAFGEPQALYIRKSSAELNREKV